MTHKDIYIKFMIEYDKANVTSSYPSLTEYEVATVLDKAYNALIAQKVTGNNVRRSTFESDRKSIADITPLVNTEELNNIIQTVPSSEDITNVMSAELPSDFLYHVGFKIRKTFNKITSGVSAGGTVFEAGNSKQADPIDQKVDSNILKRKLNVKIVPHEVAEKFIATATNIPWVKDPVGYIENNTIYIVYDSMDLKGISGTSGSTPGIDAWVEATYIKKPNPFVKSLSDAPATYESFFDWGQGDVPEAYQFECNETVAEELISLAVAFALENVESQRLNSKLNMRGLEA